MRNTRLVTGYPVTRVWVVTTQDPNSSDPFNVEALISQKAARDATDAIELAMYSVWEDLFGPTSDEPMTFEEYQASQGEVSWDCYLMPILLPGKA